MRIPELKDQKEGPQIFGREVLGRSGPSILLLYTPSAIEGQGGSDLVLLQKLQFKWLRHAQEVGRQPKVVPCEVMNRWHCISYSDNWSRRQCNAMH